MEGECGDEGRDGVSVKGLKGFNVQRRDGYQDGRMSQGGMGQKGKGEDERKKMKTDQLMKKKDGGKHEGPKEMSRMGG